MTEQQLLGLVIWVTLAISVCAAFIWWRIDIAADRIIAAIEQLKKDQP